MTQKMDKNVEAVCAKLRQRAEVGLNKYGVGTDKAGLSPEEWIKHAQEEAMDFCVYLEALLEKLAEREARIRAEERERCARLVEKSEWSIIAGEIKVSGEANSILQKQISAALRSGTDTDYVCVRREELEKVNEFIAREQAADFEDEDDKCEQSEGAREICERALGTHHGKRLLRDW